MNEKRRHPKEEAGPPAEGGKPREEAERGPDRDRADAAYGAFRPAGPEAMKDPPEGPWDIVDEGSDESFPASDPPSFMGGATRAPPSPRKGTGEDERASPRERPRSRDDGSESN